MLDKRINFMTELKQIIGRGTRINEDYYKLFFTIMNFKQATALFADPNFDGEPVQIYEPGFGDLPVRQMSRNGMKAKIPITGLTNFRVDLSQGL